MDLPNIKERQIEQQIAGKDWKRKTMLDYSSKTRGCSYPCDQGWACITIHVSLGIFNDCESYGMPYHIMSYYRFAGRS